MAHDRSMQASLEASWQQEYDERFADEAVSDCCESSWSEDGDNESKWATCDKCNKECTVIEL